MKRTVLFKSLPFGMLLTGLLKQQFFSAAQNGDFPPPFMVEEISDNQLTFYSTDRISHSNICLQACSAAQQMAQPLSGTAMICSDFGATDISSAQGLIAIHKADLLSPDSDLYVATGKLVELSAAAANAGAGQQNARNGAIPAGAGNQANGEVTGSVQFDSSTFYEVGLLSRGVGDLYYASNLVEIQDHDRTKSGVFGLETPLLNDEVICFGARNEASGFSFDHLEVIEGGPIFPYNLYVTSMRKTGFQASAETYLRQVNWNINSETFLTDSFVKPIMLVNFEVAPERGFSKIKLMKDNRSGHDWRKMRIIPVPADICDRVTDCNALEDVKDVAKDELGYEQCNFQDVNDLYVEATDCLYTATHYMIWNDENRNSITYNIIGQIFQEGTEDLPQKTGTLIPTIDPLLEGRLHYNDDIDALSMTVQLQQGILNEGIRVPKYAFDVAVASHDLERSLFGALESYTTVIKPSDASDETLFIEFEVDLSSNPTDLGELPLTMTVYARQRPLNVATSDLYFTEINIEVLPCTEPPLQTQFTCIFYIDDVYNNNNSMQSAECLMTLAETACDYELLAHQAGAPQYYRVEPTEDAQNIKQYTFSLNPDLVLDDYFTGDFLKLFNKVDSQTHAEDIEVIGYFAKCSEFFNGDPVINGTPFELIIGSNNVTYTIPSFSTSIGDFPCGDLEVYIEGDAASFTTVELDQSNLEVAFTIDPAYFDLQSGTAYHGTFVARYSKATYATVSTAFEVTFIPDCQAMFESAPQIDGTPFNYFVGGNVDVVVVPRFWQSQLDPSCGNLQFSIDGDVDYVADAQLNSRGDSVNLAIASNLSGIQTSQAYSGALVATFSGAAHAQVSAPFQVTYNVDCRTMFLDHPVINQGDPFVLKMGEDLTSVLIQRYISSSIDSSCGDFQVKFATVATSNLEADETQLFAEVSLTRDRGVSLTFDPKTQGIQPAYRYYGRVDSYFSLSPTTLISTLYEVVFEAPDVDCNDFLLTPTMPDDVPFELTMDDEPQVFELESFATVSTHPICGDLVLSIEGSASQFAKVKLLETLNVELTVNPQQSGIVPETSYTGEIIATFVQEEQEARLLASSSSPLRRSLVSSSWKFELIFYDETDPCIDSTIKYVVEGFTSEYLVDVDLLTESDQTLEIDWAPLKTSYDESACLATFSTEVTFLGAGGLSATWAAQDTENGKTTIDLQDASILGLQASKIVTTTVTSSLTQAAQVEGDADTVYASDQFSFTVKFEKVEEPEPEPEEEEKEEETQEEPVEQPAETQEETQEFTAFEGVKITDRKKKARDSGPKVTDPIRTKVAMASETGNILITFSRPVEIDFPTIKSGSRRELQSTYTLEEMKKLEQLINIEYETAVEEGEGEVPALLQKQVVKASTTEIEFQMTYSKPLAVSRNPQDPDLIVFSFNKEFFSDPLTDFEINNGKPLIVKLPRQIDAGEAAAIEGAMSAANGAGNAVATGNLVLNIVLGASLKTLWGMINTLQFVVFFTEWNVQIPPNAMLAIKTFRVIALGEFIPYDWLTNYVKGIFGSDDDAETTAENGEGDSEESADEADGVEEDKSNVLANMGVMLVILLLMVVLILVVFLAIKCCKKGSFLHKKFEAVKKKIFWNSILRYILQSYLKTALGAAFAVRLISFANGSSTTKALISITLCTVLAFIPLIFAIVMHKNKERLTRTATKAQIGSLYLGTRTESFMQRSYPSVFIFRRFLYAVLTVACINNANILIHVYLLSNVIYVVYLGLAEPNDTFMGRRIEYFNETGLQIVTYHLALFPLALTADDEALIGWSMIFSVVGIFAVNLCIMLTSTIKGVCRKCYLKKLRKQNLKEAEERKKLAQLQQDVSIVDQKSPSKRKLVKSSSTLKKASVLTMNPLDAIIEESKYEDGYSSSSSSEEAKDSQVFYDVDDQWEGKVHHSEDISKVAISEGSVAQYDDYGVRRHPNEVNKDDDEGELYKTYLAKNEPVDDMIKRIETDFLKQYGDASIFNTNPQREPVKNLADMVYNQPETSRQDNPKSAQAASQKKKKPKHRGKKSAKTNNKEPGLGN